MAKSHQVLLQRFAESNNDEDAEAILMEIEEVNFRMAMVGRLLFKQFSTTISKAENIHAASGGYLLFADYSNAQGRFFIIAMIKQKEGMRLSRQLVPEELTQLDLDRLYQAARINFGKLSAYQTATESDRQEQNYLSFVSPSNSKTAAGYFVTALGCAQGTASARATDTIIRESVGFFRQHDELSRYRQAFKNDLLDHLTRKEREGRKFG